MAASWRTLLLLLCLAVLRSEGSCFGRDASFTPGAKPVVTQPSRNDPSKVMVDWSKIVKNAQCVDKFVVWMWPDGTERIGKSAVSKEVSKTTMSAIMDMEACVNYRFAVELDEKEMTGNKKFSGEQLFKTAGQAKVLRLSASDFTVGYHWDPVRQVSDLRLASVSFPRSAIEHASCLDYIQVTGEEVRAGRPTLSRQASTASMTGRVQWSHLPPSPRPGSPISVGSASTLPGSLGFGRSSSVMSSTSRSSSGSSGYVSPFGPVETPRYANSLPRKTGASNHVGPVKVQPPFINPMIEILVAAKDCAEYNFEVKLFAPTSREVKKISGVHLPSLANLPYYVPPPITDVMSISFGTSGKPVYGVKTSSGVSAACLPAYFEALDAFRQRLENEISHLGAQGSGSPRPGQGGQGSNIGGQGSSGGRGGSGGFLGGLVGGSSGSREDPALKKAGCICTSPNLKFDTTDAALKKKTPQIFGRYQFAGTEGGRPFYQKTPASTPPTFLFWMQAEKQWMVGPTKGNKSGGIYSSTKNSLAVCPGDPPSSGNWQRKSSFLGRWKKEATLSMTCDSSP